MFEFGNPFCNTFKASSYLGAAAVAKPVVQYTLIGTAVLGAATGIAKVVSPIIEKQIIEPAINGMAAAAMDSISKLNNGNFKR